MTIVVYHKLLKFRLILDKIIKSINNDIKLYSFGDSSSIKKLLSFKEVNVIIIDAETLQCENDIFLNLENKSNVIISYIVLSYNKNYNASLLPPNSYSILIDPEGNYSNEQDIKIVSRNINSTLNKIKIKQNNQNSIIKTRRSETISKNIKVILIGVSTGGPKALRNLLPELTSTTNLPIIIVQHILKNYTDSFIRSLALISKSPVLRVANGLKIENKHVYIAPGGLHTTVEKHNNLVSLHLDDSPPEESVKPSVNFLFRTAADVFGKDAIGIILTGMGCDGTEGAKKLTDKGAYLIAQDELSCDVWSMPKNVIQNGYVNKVLPLEEISLHVKEILG